ncbi:CheA Chemotaxis protein histidine kinase and related kinases [Burkholderiales bacterium]
MSDDFIETIWAQYAVETEEHIEGIESALVRADSESLTHDEISGLFRAFHSLKGLSRVMELAALESVTHRSEDLLGLVRDGATSLDKPMVDLLLRALDAIKTLRDLAVSQRSDGEKPEALVKELVAAFKRASGAAADEPAAPAAVATPVSAPVGSSAADAPAVEGTTPPAPAVSKPKPELRAPTEGETSDDQEIFLRLVKNGLPILEQLAKSIAAKEDPSKVMAVANDIRRPLSWMQRAATKLGYIGIETRIHDILKTLPKDEGYTQETGERVVDAIVALLGDLQFLGETTGSDLGGESLANVLSRTLKDNLQVLLGQVNEQLDGLESSVDMADDDLADLISQAFSRVHSYLSSIYPEMHCDLPLMFVDAYARAARRQLAIYSDVIDLTRDAIRMIKELGTSKLKNPLSQPELAAQSAKLVGRMKDYLWSNDSTGTTPVDAVKAFVAHLNIPPELSALLSPENTRELMEAIQSGHEAYLITAHLESSEELASSFLGWVSRRGAVITNRSVFVDEASWYEMLFISTATRSEVERELQDIDQGRGLVRLGPPLGQTSPVAPVTPIKAVTTSSSGASVGQEVTTAEAGAAPGKPAAARPAAATSNVIRVPGEMLDHFMNQIGEMVLVRGQLAHVIADQRIREMALALRRVSDRLPPELAGSADMQRLLDLVDEQGRRLQETDALIQGALSRLQDSVMGLRVVPVELVFKRFPRMVRDLAQAQGKQIRLELIGQEVKIDKAMVESLADPLLHMVRNSADHGVELPEERRRAGKPEEAVIRISAEQQGSRILIKVTDDGKGIDAERVRRKAVERGLVKEDDSHLLSKDEVLKFIFRAGFSTAEVVTETSGRGVGMDVVRTNVMRLGGSIQLDSELGQGTSFTMQMPLSAAVQEVLLVNASRQTLAIPGRYVAEVVEIDGSEIQSVKGRQALLLRGSFLPIVRLDELLGFRPDRSLTPKCIVVLSDGQRTLGVSVDEFVGRQELFTKDIHPRLAALPGVGGASILGDGRVVLILDGAALYRLAENFKPSGSLSLAA